MLGQQINNLVSEKQPAGYYEVEWDGKDDFGDRVTSGVYVYRLKTGNTTLNRKMLLLR